MRRTELLVGRERQSQTFAARSCLAVKNNAAAGQELIKPIELADIAGQERLASRRALPRSKLKIEVPRHAPLARHELATEIVFQGDASERVFEQFGVRADAGPRLRGIDQLLAD